MREEENEQVDRVTFVFHRAKITVELDENEDLYFCHPLTNERVERLDQVMQGWSEQDEGAQAEWEILLAWMKERVEEDLLAQLIADTKEGEISITTAGEYSDGDFIYLPYTIDVDFYEFTDEDCESWEGEGAKVYHFSGPFTAEALYHGPETFDGLDETLCIQYDEKQQFIQELEAVGYRWNPDGTILWKKVE